MAIVKSKPTSPGSRFVVRIKNDELHKGKPFAPLLSKNSKSGGRNNQGRIAHSRKSQRRRRVWDETSQQGLR